MLINMLIVFCFLYEVFPTDVMAHPKNQVYENEEWAFMVSGDFFLFIILSPARGMVLLWSDGCYRREETK